MAKVCRKWRLIAYDTRLWQNVSLRPEISGLHVGSLESLLALISVRFGPSLRYIELPIELITHNVLHELASKCPNLTHMLLDFSTAMQLHDFSEMQAFPARLKYLCICLSEVIFMEGFMRKIYNFINGLEILHLIGTYEKIEEEEEEIYEVINVHKLKSATPNLRVINLYGINFVDDSHIDAFSSNCIQVRLPLSEVFCTGWSKWSKELKFYRNLYLTWIKHSKKYRYGNECRKKGAWWLHLHLLTRKNKQKKLPFSKKLKVPGVDKFSVLLYSLPVLCVFYR